MTATLHRIACGCGWSYETNHRDFGSLYCRRAYEQHTPNCPLRLAAPVSGTDRAETWQVSADDGSGMMEIRPVTVAPPIGRPRPVGEWEQIEPA